MQYFFAVFLLNYLYRFIITPHGYKKEKNRRKPQFHLLFLMIIQTAGLLSIEAVFSYAAERANPILRNIFPCCARSYSVIRVACFRVINITAYAAYIFIHFISSFNIHHSAPGFPCALTLTILQLFVPQFHRNRVRITYTFESLLPL